MYKSGIILNKSFLSFEWISSSETVSLYIYLLLEASSDGDVVFGHNLQRGQLMILRSTLMRDLGISSQRLSTAMHRLKDGGCIIIDKVRKYYLITLNKYDDYATPTK
jgi:hypothetical protein